MIDWLKFFSRKQSTDHKSLSSEEKLRRATSKVQKLVDAKFAEIDGAPPPADSPLSQVNLLGGDQVVYDYLAHGESSLAWDHLRYMIEETSIDLPSDLDREIHEIAAFFRGIKKGTSENQTKIVFERDSVCAGDDVYAPNPQDFAFDTPPLLSEVLNLEAVNQYLPNVFQSKTHWTVIYNGQQVAKIEHSYVYERRATINLLTEAVVITSDRIFFQYECQERIER